MPAIWLGSWIYFTFFNQDKKPKYATEIILAVIEDLWFQMRLDDVMQIPK